MSQYPQQPQYPGQGYPQQYPPQGYPQQGYPQGAGGPPKQGNGAAVASLVLGLFGCVPVLTSLLAILFGFSGISKSKQPGRGGKGMAIVGILLGLGWLVAWGVMGYVGWRFWEESKEFIKPSMAMLQAMEQGDYTKAREFATARMSEKELRALREEFRSLGELQNLQFSGSVYSNVNGIEKREITGSAVFANGSRRYKVIFLKEQGTWKIDQFILD